MVAAVSGGMFLIKNIYNQKYRITTNTATISSHLNKITTPITPTTLPHGHQLPNTIPIRPKRRHERGDHHETGVHKQRSDVPDPPYILHPIRIGEAEIATEAVSDVVAVEDVGLDLAGWVEEGGGYRVGEC